MQTPLNASASTAGALLSSSIFEVPQFQREYSWQEDEISDFWNDLSNGIDSESYFLGLVILTDEGGRKVVVDGQQRLITLSLLATAIFFEAQSRGRSALADRIRADFLRSIDYDSDETHPRVLLSDKADNATFQLILEKGDVSAEIGAEESVSRRLAQSYRFLRGKLQGDLGQDPFKRLGKWTEFLTHRVYFAVFIHPDPSSAYQVYEVINTRGKELTTADLLKNYVLSQTAKEKRQRRYNEWQRISGQFPSDGPTTFVQYIRHSVTVRSGHILPKDLFGFLAQRVKHPGKKPPAPDELMRLLNDYLPSYLQMADPTLAGPADPESLQIFAALNALDVIAVRPILLAIAHTKGLSAKEQLDGMSYVLRLVVRRIVVGNLGTGNVERRFGEAASNVFSERNWKVLIDDLGDLNPSKGDFIDQLGRRSFNKGTLSFLRRSILAKTIAPDQFGVLHFIWPRQGSDWEGVSEEDMAFWGSTIGNTFLANVNRRPKGAGDWQGFKEQMLPFASEHEWKSRYARLKEWDASAVEKMGKDLAKVAGDIWYP
ncbi:MULTISPECIES: DUF262 domain-containing protein [unclassified Bradyrhizobium]|uniref:DUF262 domain-containing protein n=1 Tax=unclassified Bradyrhizobium TaxID=2631580 RepID=UPI002915FEA7|nr:MULTISPECIES: DUF262 domain-containing protein [unclassified Bradyrhizobium]